MKERILGIQNLIERQTQYLDFMKTKVEIKKKK